MAYLLHVLVLIAIYALLAVSYDMLIGYTGLFSIAQAALFGVGAYASAIVAFRLHAGFPAGLLAAVLAGAVVSALVAVPALRVSGDYLVIASFGIQIVLQSLFLNLDDLTGGPGGLRGIPHPRLFGYTFGSAGSYLLLVLVIGLVVALLLRNVLNSSFGLLLRALREDELVPQALGKDVVAIKVKVFVLSGAVAGLAGSLYAHYITFVSPETFGVQESIFMLSLVLVGGMGTLWGPILGAALLVSLPEALRLLPFPSSWSAPMRQIIYGLLLIAFTVVRPRGLLGRRTT